MKTTGTIAKLAALAAALLVAFVTSHGTAEAASITVNTASDVVADDGLCSLREAITAANIDTAASATSGECAAGRGADTITLPADTYTLSLGSELVVSTDLVINGAGAKSTIIEAATSPGVANWRVFNITGGTVSISDVTVRHGKLADHGAGILNVGILTVTDSTFSDNDSGTTRHGGAIKNDFGATLTVVRSTFTGNSASEGGAIQNRNSTATISNTTFSGNSASNSGGGLDNIGTGFSTTVNNSTFTGNSAGSGGGVFNIFGTVTLNNTIVFGNSGSAAREDCFGAGISSLGHNLVGIGTGCPTGGTGDLTTADAKLDVLADNGGPTKTHALIAGSPAIGAGDPAAPGTGGTACEATDQRSTSRPQGTQCDIGAFELVAAVATPTPVPGLSQWGFIAMVALMGLVVVWRLRRRTSRRSA